MLFSPGCTPVQPFHSPGCPEGQEGSPAVPSEPDERRVKTNCLQFSIMVLCHNVRIKFQSALYSVSELGREEGYTLNCQYF